MYNIDGEICYYICVAITHNNDNVQFPPLIASYLHDLCCLFL